MASGIFRVSWLGQGQIVWERLQETPLGLVSADFQSAPMRAVLQMAAEHSDTARVARMLLDPVGASLSDIKNAVQLTQDLVATGIGLQLINLFVAAQTLRKVREIEDTVKDIRGKFELLFLKESIDYFISAHENRIGIDVLVAEALEQDLLQAITEMIEQHSLAAPAFLRHRIASLADALDHWNQVQFAALNGGTLRKLSAEELKAWVPTIHGKATSVAPVAGYISQEIALKNWCHNSDTELKKAADEPMLIKAKRKLTFSPESGLVEKALAQENRDRCFHSVRLLMELDAARRYHNLLEMKLKDTEEKSMVIISPKSDAHT